MVTASILALLLLILTRKSAPKRHRPGFSLICSMVRKKSRLGIIYVLWHAFSSLHDWRLCYKNA